MAEKMDLIVAGPDRHVLAAALRHNKAGGDPTASDLVGDGLRLRDPETGDTIVTVPAEELSLVQADLREDVLLTARNFALVDNLPEESASPHGTPITLSGSTITVNLPAPATEDTNVWAFIEGGPQPIVHKLTVAATTSTSSEPLQLPSGSYRALVLATGVRAAVVAKAMP
jgi:hypothetical protein